MADFDIPYLSLNEDQKKIVKDNSYLVTFKKGDIIYRQDHPVSHLTFVKSGIIKIFREQEREKTAILKISLADDYIGLLSAFHGNLYRTSASALENSDIIYTKMETVRDIFESNSNFALSIMEEMSRESFCIINNMVNICQKQVTGRIANILLFFSEKVYKKPDFCLPLTRQELAELVCTTKETVSRTLTEFRNDRIIDIDERKISLKSIDLLRILSNIG